MIDFKGNSYTFDKSDLTGGNWFHYSKNPEDFKIPSYQNVQAVTKIQLPAAYIIPAAWQDIISVLKNHGAVMIPLKKTMALNVKMYRFSDVQFAKTPYEGRFQVQKFQLWEEDTVQIFPAGSMVVLTNYRNAKIIAHALEPQAPSSLLKWGLFNSIFEQKEYSETYVMEGVAREMMKKNPALKAEFEKRKTAGEFGDDQWEMLNWFYKQSDWRDTEMYLYPIGKIYSKDFLELL
jgi:hypothetical protein